MIACFLSNISAKYYKNLSVLSRVIAKNVRDVFFETQCILSAEYRLPLTYSAARSLCDSWATCYDYERCAFICNEI